MEHVAIVFSCVESWSIAAFWTDFGERLGCNVYATRSGIASVRLVDLVAWIQILEVARSPQGKAARYGPYFKPKMRPLQRRSTQVKAPPYTASHPEGKVAIF